MRVFESLGYLLAIVWLAIPIIVTLISPLIFFNPTKLKQQVISGWKATGISTENVFLRRVFLVILWPCFLFPMTFPRYGFLAGLILFMFVGFQPLLVEKPIPNEIQMKRGAEYISALEIKGQALRNEIDNKYYKWTFTSSNDVNLDNVFRKYIPAGTSIDDAEYILRIAGFRIGKRLLNNSNRTNKIDAYSQYLHGSIPSYSKFMFGVEIFVRLKLKQPYDYSEVVDATGEFNAASL